MVGFFKLLLLHTRNFVMKYEPFCFEPIISPSVKTWKTEQSYFFSEQILYNIKKQRLLLRKKGANSSGLTINMNYLNYLRSSEKKNTQMFLSQYIPCRKWVSKWIKLWNFRATSNAVRTVWVGGVSSAWNALTSEDAGLGTRHNPVIRICRYKDHCQGGNLGETRLANILFNVKKEE